MATFVLVHGAFHGAWCWRKLVPALAARGARAVTLDLPAQGDDRTPIADATLAGNAGRVMAALRAESGPVVLVGHSLGGVSISAAAELAPERVRMLVYLCAFMPGDGESVASIGRSMPPKADGGPRAFTRADDGLSYSPVPELAREVFYSRCSDEDVAYALARLRPQPYSVQRAPVALTAERFGRVPRVYVETLGDNTVSLELQRAMVARMPCPVVTLDTDHSPFFSAPDLLADTLVKVAG